MTQPKLTSKQMLLNEIACALTDHMTEEYGSGHFVDLTTGEVTFIQSEYMLEDVTPEELSEYREWEQEQIKQYAEHNLIKIDCVPSHESFRVMERFVESRPEREHKSLYVALVKRHPFREFRAKVERMGLLQEWYDFKNSAEETMAQEWLEEHDLEIIDGKIVRCKSAIIPNPEFEHLFDSRYLDTDCDRIADNVSDVLRNLEEAYLAGAREIAVQQMLQLAWANCRHFILEEHWCYFDDMYSPEYIYDRLLEYIAKDIAAGVMPDELSAILYDGLKAISKTECVKEYGYLDLEEHFSSIVKRMKNSRKTIKTTIKNKGPFP